MYVWMDERASGREILFSQGMDGMKGETVRGQSVETVRSREETLINDDGKKSTWKFDFIFELNWIELNWIGTGLNLRP